MVCIRVKGSGTHVDYIAVFLRFNKTFPGGLTVGFTVNGEADNPATISVKGDAAELYHFGSKLKNGDEVCAYVEDFPGKPCETIRAHGFLGGIFSR